MTEISISRVTPQELVQLINEGIKNQLHEFTTCINSKSLSEDKPHLTKRETAKFFDVSLNCINDWSKKGILNPMKVGQRVYFSKQECIQAMFNQNKAA
jgi:hypothetical protein